MTSSGTPDLDVIMKFLEAPLGSGQERMLCEHPELLDDVYQRALAALAAEARERDPAWADLIDRSRGFLAWRRSNPSSPAFAPGKVVAAIPPELADAFQALGQSDPAAACREHPELLGEQCGDLLRSINREATTVGDTAIAEATERQLRTIDCCRVAFASLLLGKAIGREVPDAILDGVDAMLGAPSWRQARDAIEQHPSLLGDESDALWLMLLACARENGDRYAVRSYFEQRRFLLTARAFGPDLAVAQWSEWAGAVPDELRSSLSEATECASQAVASEGPAELRAASELCERLLRQPGIERAPAGFRASALMAAAATALALDRHEPSPQRQADAIGRLQAALELLPEPAANREPCLANLGQGFQRRFETSADVADQRAAAEALFEAAETATVFSPRRGDMVAAASAALTTLADLTGELEPLDRCVSLRTEDLDFAGPFPVARAECALALALAHFDRYLRTADTSALDTAIAALEREADRIGAIAARANVVHQLGHLLLRRYQARGGVDVLDRARRVLGDAIDAAKPGSALRSVALDHLGCVMQETYRRSGAEADLNRAVELGEEAVSQLDDERFPGPFPAVNLANSLLLRYDLAGDRRDLTRAVEICEREDAGSDDFDRLAALIGLGNTFRFVYQRTGDIDLLDRAVACLERALGAFGARSAVHSYAATGLVTALFLRHRLTRRDEDLDRIVELSERVVDDDAPGAPRAAGSLGNLGVALTLRWQERGHADDLRAGIETLEHAVELATKGSDQDRVDTANLAAALLSRAEGDDVQRAIELLKPIDEAAAPATPERARRLVTLGGAYADRHARSERAEDLARALTAYREASGASIAVWPELALSAARGWADSAAVSGSWREAAEGAEAGLRALRELFRAQLVRSHKELRVGQGLGLASLAAYAHCRARRPEDAATALEAGRGLLLREALDRDRADLDALARSGRDELAGRYRAAVARCSALAVPADRDAGAAKIAP